jgi:hypothetical protein
MSFFKTNKNKCRISIKRNIYISALSLFSVISYSVFSHTISLTAQQETLAAQVKSEDEIKEFIFERTVSIIGIDSKTGYGIMGTGFLYAIPADTYDSFTFYLMTN